jgi:hypothetical protein
MGNTFDIGKSIDSKGVTKDPMRNPVLLAIACCNCSFCGTHESTHAQLLGLERRNSKQQGFIDNGLF